MAFVIANLVKETTTTVGTGPLTLDGAMVGHRPFSAKCAIGDTFFYALRAVDAAGAPTGEFEHGLGTYSAPNTITRTTVDDSSNAGTVVNLSAGTKQVYISMSAVQVAWVRERLTAARTYYVRTDGADTNTGLADTAGGAFLTIQKAIDVTATLDLSVYNVAIQVRDGTRTQPNTLKKCLGAGTVTIQGNAATPANVLVNVTNDNCFFGENTGTKYILKDMKLTGSGANNFGIQAVGGQTYIEYSNIDFGACGGGHIYARNGSYVRSIGASSVNGSSVYHVRVQTGATLSFGSSLTYTITGTPAFSGAFAYSSQGAGIQSFSNTFSGSATGSRYLAEINAYINTFGAGANHFPGDVAGTTATGGQYA